MARVTAHNANVWVNCSGALSLQSQYPRPVIEGEEISEAAKEGLAFHEIAERILKTFTTPDAPTFDRVDIVGQLSAHGLPFDDEMYDHARDYVNNIMAVKNNSESTALFVESRVDLSPIYPQRFAVCDALVIDHTAKHVTIWDAKYGRSIVEVFENWQLLVYASCLFADFKDYKFDLRIYQPRAYHRDGVCRSWVLTGTEVLDYLHRVLRPSANNAESGGDGCNTGTWCYNASCRRVCETFQRQVYDGLDYVGESVGNDLRGANLSVEIVHLQRVQDQLKARLKALEESAIVYARKGESLPGMMVEETYGRKAWRKDIDQEEVISMGDLLGVDLRKPRELATPAQCLKKGLDECVINEYSETPKNGWKLVTVTAEKIKMMFK